MPFTTNIVLEQPVRGSYVGTWDTPVNSNTGIIDQAFGSVTTLALTNVNVTLASSQAQNSIIRLTGTLTGNVAITMASIYKFWTIDNQLVNSPSSFYATLVSTAGTSIIGCPPGTTDVFYDGTSVKYRNLGRVGEYWDYAGSAVPSWVTACTKPPWLNCNGTAFSSATYPILANLLGTTTLPDSRGRNRYTLNQTTGRLTSAGAGIDGNTAYAAGGNNGVTLASSQIPTITSTGANTITITTSAPIPIAPSSGAGIGSVAAVSGGGFNVPYLTLGGGWSGTSTLASTNQISVTYTNSSQAVVGNAAPGYVGGITMIRAE